MRDKKNHNKKLVSIIVPAYKQEKTIVKDLKRIQNTLNQTRYRFEIILVVDGVVDKTYELAKGLAGKNIKVFKYSKNRGKGYAIRYGMIRSKGNLIGFIDSGMDLNPNGISMLLEHFEWYDADIIIGSKRHPVSKINYPPSREVISFLSQIYIKFLFGLNVRDTQVGLKFFKRDIIRDVLPRLRVDRFAFDIEVLVVAYHLGYKKIYEAPVELQFNAGNSFISQNYLDAIFKTLIDTLKIFYRLKLTEGYSTRKKRLKSDYPKIFVRKNKFNALFSK